jgi:hypothetical protein
VLTGGQGAVGDQPGNPAVAVGDPAADELQPSPDLASTVTGTPAAGRPLAVSSTCVLRLILPPAARVAGG